MSSISGICSNSGYATQSMPRQRPNPQQMAEQLFSKLDTNGQGFIEKADLQKAIDGLGNAASNTTATTGSNNIDQLFSTLDGNSDGKVTKDEFSSALQKVSEQLDQQFMNLRMNGGEGGMHGLHQGPPPGGNKAGGFTKDELQSQLDKIGATDNKRSELLSKIVNNFDQADTDGDGKVSFKEARAYDKSTTATATASVDNTSTASNDGNVKMLQQIMQLMRAYGSGSGHDNNTISSTLAVSA